MKNIHLIPTDKPSRLVIDTIENKLYYQSILHNKTVNVLTQNIYITNDEEIKDGDYFWKPDCNMIFKADYTPHKGCQKVALTTDQDLIKDGVQAINDEFLQWFVKNPSCEWVNVDKESHIEIEEVSYEGDFQNVEYINYKIIIPKEEPKQETIEEAAVNCYAEGTWDNRHNFTNGFIEGAKWQQERSYSEEEVLELLKKAHFVEQNIDEWFEKFKK